MQAVEVHGLRGFNRADVTDSGVINEDVEVRRMLVAGGGD
jgi:hypothetical protein